MSVIDTLAQNVCMLISLFLGPLKSLTLRPEIFSYTCTAANDYCCLQIAGKKSGGQDCLCCFMRKKCSYH